MLSARQSYLVSKNMYSLISNVFFNLKWLLNKWPLNHVAGVFLSAKCRFKSYANWSELINCISPEIIKMTDRFSDYFRENRNSLIRSHSCNIRNKFGHNFQGSIGTFCMWNLVVYQKLISSNGIFWLFEFPCEYPRKNLSKFHTIWLC